jgi:hypothetical protein
MYTQRKGNTRTKERFKTMKFIITYTAKRKNAKRHVQASFGKKEYFNSVEEAKKHYMFSHPLYNVEIMSADYKETFAKNY